MVVVLLAEAGVMTVTYPRRYLRTRRQLVWQSVVSALILLPPLVWRFTSERIVVSLTLAGFALAAFGLSYRGLRYLAAQERQHREPTPDMTFVFMLVAIYPLAISVFLLVLLAET
jgi:hypothetical protein